MRPLLWVILLALAWCAVNGEFSGPQLTVGFTLGFFITLFVQTGGRDYLRRVKALFAFIAFFLWELVIANLRVARDVISPRPRIVPGVIAVPLEIRGPLKVSLLANLITLTPGSVTLDISEDGSVLYIHSMYARDAEAVRHEVKQGFERRLRELLS